MQSAAVVLANNVGVVADQPAVTWPGGKCVLVLKAGTYPTTCKLQFLAADGVTWIDINGTTFSANQVTAYELPPGQVQLHLTGGAVATMFATLVRIPYC